MATKILLFGAGGQVGRELATRLTDIGEVVALDRARCDVTNLNAVKAMLDLQKPALVVNAAAHTAVDAAESETELARQINAGLPETLAKWCAQHDALLVDFSTDYIFDGKKREPWQESDKRSPLNAYGQTKLEGLQAIEKSGSRYLVFIVTWVYAPEGKNFPNTMLRLAAEKDELNVVADQVGAPTPANWIAEKVAECISQVIETPEKVGLYNLAPAGRASWHDFAREIITQALAQGRTLTLTPDDIRPVTTADYPTPAARPANSVLNTAKLTSAFGIMPPHWRTLYRDTL